MKNKSKIPTSDPIFRSGMTGLIPIVHYFDKDNGKRIHCRSSKNPKDYTKKVIVPDFRGTEEHKTEKPKIKDPF